MKANDGGGEGEGEGRRKRTRENSRSGQSRDAPSLDLRLTRALSAQRRNVVFSRDNRYPTVESHRRGRLPLLCLLAV